MEVGDGSVVSPGPRIEGVPESQRPDFDLNGVAAHSQSTRQGSGADGRLTTPHVVFSSISPDDYVARSGASTPRTPHRAPSDASSLPEHLHAQFFEWLRSKSLLPEAEGLQTPQSKKLTEAQLARRQDISESARRQRHLILQDRRESPRGNMNEDANRESMHPGTTGTPRGPLFSENNHPLL